MYLKGFLSCFIFMCCISFSLLSAGEEKKSSVEGVGVDKARLIVHRDSFTPPLSFKPMVTINSVKAFYLPRGHHAVLDIDPGEYTVLFDWKAGHGPSDSEVKLDLKAGESTYVKWSGSLSLPISGFIESGVFVNASGSDNVDLTESKKITRWHLQWLRQSVGGFDAEETLNERYALTIDNQKIIEDFIKGDDQQKLQVIKYLNRIQLYDEEILSVMEKMVLENYKTDFQSKANYQALVHVAKFIASSGMAEFKDTINQVRLNATHSRVRKYGKRFMEVYYGFSGKE